MPRTYEDLLEPRWDGKITIARYADWLATMFEIVDDPEAYFTALRKQDPLVADQFTPALLPVVSGEYQLTMTTTSGALATQQADGAPVAGYFPDVPTPARAQSVGWLTAGWNPAGGAAFRHATGRAVTASAFDALGDLDVVVDRAVATIRMLASGDEQYTRHRGEVPTYFPKHKQLGKALQALRNDDTVQVIVLTGTSDHFFVPPSTSPGGGRGHTPEGDWQLTLGLSQTLQAFVETEKPIVARVNGDAIGFGSSLVFACDFVVAAQDALIADHHLGMGDLPYGRDDVGVVPGDGGAVFVPLALPPCAAKEYLLLARPYRASELATMGVFNRAVPAAELDAAVEDLVERLLRRPLYALAWGKRVINRLAADQLNRVFDAAWAYEVANFGMNRDGVTSPGSEEGSRP